MHALRIQTGRRVPDASTAYIPAGARRCQGERPAQPSPSTMGRLDIGRSPPHWFTAVCNPPCHGSMTMFMRLHDAALYSTAGEHDTVSHAKSHLLLPCIRLCDMSPRTGLSYVYLYVQVLRN